MEKNKHVFLAKSADIVGKVKIGERSSVWFQAVLRGDYNEIIVGEGSNIQDGAVVHVDSTAPVKIGDNVTIGHNCIVHGCTIGDNSLIGMGATLMNHSEIGRNSIVGANSLVTEGKVYPENSLILGSPAKWIRELTSEEVESSIKNAKSYVTNSQDYQSQSYRLSKEGYTEVYSSED